jgi:hypothetical protein
MGVLKILAPDNKSTSMRSKKPESTTELTPFISGRERMHPYYHSSRYHRQLAKCRSERHTLVTELNSIFRCVSRGILHA